MTPTERRATASLASIFALRMLGMFLVLPVFALEARGYAGGDDAARVGLAMGIYGLTQAVFQLPLGLASDRLGRKRVIVLGLLVFAAGSLIAAAASSVEGLIFGRALQGAGAISAAVTALLADLTRDDVRTKAMAVIGASIGLMFALSLVIAPVLAAWLHLSGLFVLIAVLALGGVAVVLWGVPPEPARAPASAAREGVLVALRHPALLRLNAGVFILHAVQIAMWVAVPALLVQAGLTKDHHWQVYLPAVLASFVVMGGTLFPLERRGRLRLAFLGAIGLIGASQLGLWFGAERPDIAHIGLMLFVFFCGFNVLEASQPSLVSRIAPPHMRGAALGLYNTLQSLGLFAGGALGGQLAKSWGLGAVLLAGAAAMALWLALAWSMDLPGRVPAGPKA
jgi:MFS family permease